MILSEAMAYLAVVSAGALALFVFVRRPPEPIWPSLFFVTFAAFIWAFGEVLTSFVMTTPSSYWVALLLDYVGILLLPPAWWLLALGFAELQGRPMRWGGPFVKYAPVGVAVALWVVLFTNPWHGKFIVPHLGAPNDYLVWWYVQAAVAYCLLLAVFALFLWLRWTLRRSTVRRQLDIMLAATVIGPVFNLLYVTRTVDFGFDFTVMSFVIGSAMFVWGIYRHQLFVLSPITLQHLIRGDNDGLLILDKHHLLLHANPVAEDLLGIEALRPHSEVLPILVDLLSSPHVGEDVVSPEHLVEALLTPAESRGGHVYKFRHPTRRWVRIDVTRIPGRKGEAIGLGIRIIDITELKRVEEERRNFDARLQHAQKLESLGVMAGGIAHYFNNLLMAILGNVDLALQEMPEDSSLRESIVEIEKASLRASVLCRQMLAYAGKGEFVVGPISLNKVVEDLVYLLRTSLGKKAVLNMHLERDLPAIDADASQLQQVVMNLITNASESLGDGSGKITITTSVEECDQARLSRTYLDDELPDGWYVILKVADTGCGMDLDTQEKLFEPFYSSKFTGRGLGLSAVLGIIRGHGGAIAVNSRLGDGTTLEVFLPALETLPPAAEVVSVEQAEGWRGSGTILLVDGEASVRKVGERMLRSLGFIVLSAEDGFEAVEMFKRHMDEIVCVVLGLTMPRMDGYETILRLKSIRGDVDILLATGFSEGEVSSRVEAGSVAGYLQKPYQLSTLRSKLQGVLGSLAVWLCLVAATPVTAQDFQIVETTIEQVHAEMDAGRLTCRQLVQGYLDRIEAFDQTGARLNSIQHLNPRALLEADSLDIALDSRGRVGPLHCVPVLLKDQVETSDMPTSYGSALFQDFVPERDATIVKRMKAAGAIILAKTTMGEFASRFVGSAHGIIRNAYDTDRNPSGSSGGTGVGVAANFGLVGIGEDTGGSVRGPAAVLNLVGLRPTLQLVSRHGLMPANPTQDTMGPMTRTVTDAAILLDAIVGYDPNDPITAYSVGHVPDTYTDALQTDGLRGARLGILREPMSPSAQTSSEDYGKVRSVMDSAIQEMVSLGAVIVDSIYFPDLDSLLPVANANGYETESATNEYLAAHPNAPHSTFSAILTSGVVNPWRARAMMGSVGRTTDDPGYLNVIKAREALRQNLLKLMADESLDAIVYATFDHQPTVIAPEVETNPEPGDGYGKGDNRSLSPAVGFPALTVPAGFTSDGLPVGLELLSRPFTESLLLGFGYAFEQGTDHRRPPASAPALDGGEDVRGGH